MTGQLLFTARFVVQWLKSEKEKKSVIPKAFWYFSISGGIVLLVYAIHKMDPVFIIGQASGLFIYLRNLQLIRGEQRQLRLSIQDAEATQRRVATQARNAA